MPREDRAPCSRPLCKCADFGTEEHWNLGYFRSNFNGREILRASMLLSPGLIFSSKYSPLLIFGIFIHAVLRDLDIKEIF